MIQLRHCEVEFTWGKRHRARQSGTPLFQRKAVAVPGLIRRTSELTQILEAPFVSEGSVQGIIYSWHSGAPVPFFQLRELVSGHLLRCEYPHALYKKIHEIIATPNMVVHVYGQIRWDRAKGSIQVIAADDLEASEQLSEFDFHRFFGSSPDYTGNLSTDEYISWARDGRS